MILGTGEGDLQASRGYLLAQVRLRVPGGIHAPLAADCYRRIRVFVGNRV